MSRRTKKKDMGWFDRLMHIIVDVVEGIIDTYGWLIGLVLVLALITWISK